jgi:hypothetical protein
LANRRGFAEFLKEYVIEEAVKMRHRTSSNASEVDLGQLLEEIGSFDPESKIQLQRQLSEISTSAIPSTTGTTVEPERPGSVNQVHNTHEQTLSVDKFLSVPVTQNGSASAPKDESLAMTNEQEQDIDMRRKTMAVSFYGPTNVSEETSKKLIQVEKSETGRVNPRVYAMYVSSIGYHLAVLFVTVYVLSTSLGIYSNIWLSAWSDETAKDPKSVNIGERLGVYSALGLGQGETRGWYSCTCW